MFKPGYKDQGQSLYKCFSVYVLQICICSCCRVLECYKLEKAISFMALLDNVIA